jgi:hypothetical protein
MTLSLSREGDEVTDKAEAYRSTSAAASSLEEATNRQIEQSQSGVKVGERSSDLRSTLSVETTAECLLRSTLSGGITLEPTIFCAFPIYCSLLCLARLQLTICSTLLCLA